MKCVLVLTDDQTNLRERAQQPEGYFSVEARQACNLLHGARPVLQMIGKRKSRRRAK